MNWQDLNISIVAGDRREQEIARCAVAAGANVRAFGIPWPEGGIDGVQSCASMAEAFDGVDIALCPIPGIAPDGALFAPSHSERLIPGHSDLARMRGPGHIILGWADPKLKAHCDALQITLHEYEWDKDLMLLRGQAIVEGALKIIIENTDITIHRANIVQVGQGAIGALLTHTLIALGGRVHVAARNAVQRAGAYAAGAETHELEALTELLPKADIVVTTVPARLLERELLSLVPKHAFLIDLSAPPGCIDRDAAAELGLKAIWGRGLGSRAPVTVGRSQWSGVRKRIETILASR
ncbi:dipicolinate synthase subunit A [Nitrobacteraceae bacterium AZCC 2146]